MISAQWIFDKLKRTTNSTDFLPQIDGLRFLAIAAVVIAHINTFVIVKTPVIFDDGSISSFVNGVIHGSAHKGVLLFFVISGFILGLPFAKHFLLGGRKISLKDYFLRRLTRLEPPYIINNIVFALLLIFVAQNEYSKMFADTSILQSLLASLTYTHNIFFPNNLAINSVTWSLEVEVQFYILVPLLILLFRLRPLLRRLTIVGVSFGMVVVQHFYQPEFISIFNFIQYFLAGFLLVDLHLSKKVIKLPPALDFLVGFSLVIGLLLVTLEKSVATNILFLVLLFAFGAISLLGEVWKKILSLRFFTSIGGMCYTIYLWHMAVISGLGNKVVHMHISDNYFITLLFQASIILPFVIAFSICLYLLIEKPCMDKEWPKKLAGYLKSIVVKEKTV